MDTTARPPRTPAVRTSARSRAVVDALVRAGLIDPARRDAGVEVAAEVLDGAATDAGGRHWLPEVAGYLGGAFVVAAALLFFVDAWDDLGVGARIGLLAVSAAALAVAGAIVRGRSRIPGGRPDDVRRRLAATLYAGAAACLAGVVGLIVDELDGQEWGSAPSAAFGLTLAVLALLGYLAAPTVLGQLVTAYGAVQFLAISTLDLLFGGDASELAFSAGVLVLAALWLTLAERRIWHERLAARLIGAVLVVIAVQWPVVVGPSEAGYALSAIGAAVAFAVYVRVRAWPYLVLGVGLVTVVVPEALLDWTDGTLGVAGVLLVGGLVLLGGSVVGLRVHRDAAAGA